MLETRIKFTGALEQDLRDYVRYQYANEHGAINFTIKEALIRFLEDKVDKVRERRKKEITDKFPELIGKVFASGIAKGQKGKEEKSPKHHIEAGQGEDGEVDCPNCGQLISIGSKAKNAICANCGIKIPIRRMEKEKEVKNETD